MSITKASRWLRFLMGGGINTAFTYVMYLLLIKVLSYQIAYFIAYAVGILFSYWFNAKFVFRVRLSWTGLAAYPVVYLVQYVASALLLVGFVRSAGVSEHFAPLIVTVVMVPLTYLISKLVLRRSGDVEESSSKKTDASLVRADCDQTLHG